MAAGVPLVTTRVGQAPELVADGDERPARRRRRRDALAAAVVRVHDDAALATSSAQRGRPTAEAYAEELPRPVAGHELLEGFVAGMP